MVAVFFYLFEFYVLKPSFHQHALADQIDRARHHQFMKEALPHLIGGLITSVLVYYIYQRFAIEGAEWIWLVGNIILLLSTVGFYAIYYARPNLITIKRWGQVTFMVSALWGICWALPPHIFLDTDKTLYIAVLLVVIVALATSPAPAMVHYPSGYYVFISLPLASLFYKITTLDLGGDWVLLMLVPFLWLSLLAYGWNLHGTMINSIKLRLENEQAWKEAENANVAKSKFLAAASHDIRQPLQAINLFLSALKNRNREAQDVQLFERLEGSVDSMSELLNSLLDVSKLDAQAVDVVPQHIDLRKLCQRLVNELDEQAKEKQLQLKLSCAELIAHVDPVLLERVLNNLLSNALRYTEAGAISLSAWPVEKGIHIQVQDTGIGIPESEQESIFAEFHQLANPERDRQKGLGLGLSIVQRLCQLQMWPLSMQSEVAVGSCFSIVTPVGKAEKLLLADINPSVNLQALSILVIDDDVAVQQGLIALLESWGCRAYGYDSGQTACDALQQNALPIDLIISDYRLRDSKNGVEAIAAVQGLLSEKVEAFLITGDTAPERIQEAKASGLTVLHKPVKPAQLRNIIQRKLKHLL